MLIDDLKKRSPQAFQTLVREYSATIVNTCYRFVHNRDDAEDLAQEVFIEIARSVSRFRHDADLNTWIYRISINKSLDFLRRRNRRKRLADLKSLFHLKHQPPLTPPEHLEQDERKQLLRRCLASLPDNQRIALVISRYDKLPNKQIAAVMQLTESAVESLLHRARANLRKRLAEYFEKNE